MLQKLINEAKIIIMRRQSSQKTKELSMKLRLLRPLFLRRFSDSVEITWFCGEVCTSEKTWIIKNKLKGLLVVQKLHWTNIFGESRATMTEKSFFLTWYEAPNKTLFQPRCFFWNNKHVKIPSKPWSPLIFFSAVSWCEWCVDGEIYPLGWWTTAAKTVLETNRKPEELKNEMAEKQKTLYSFKNLSAALWPCPPSHLWAEKTKVGPRLAERSATSHCRASSLPFFFLLPSVRPLWFMHRSWRRSTERQVRVTATVHSYEPLRADRRQVVEAVRIPFINQVGVGLCVYIFPVMIHRRDVELCCGARLTRFHRKKRHVESLASSLWQPWHSLSLSKTPGIFYCVLYRVSGGGEPKHFWK